MSVVLGKTSYGEINKLAITLVSNVSSKLYPNNTATDFTNNLAFAISKSEDTEYIGVRIKSIYLSKYSEVDEDGIKIKHYEPLSIRLSGLQGQIVNDYTEPVLAVANVRKAFAKSGKVKYCHVTFDRSPVVRINQPLITHLRIQLTTNSGEKYPLWNNQLIVPTIVELDLLAMNDESEFTITCMSHGSNEAFFEANSLTNFQSRLGRFLELGSWEVGLQSIALPPFLKRGEKMILKWIYFQGDERPDMDDANWRIIEIPLKNNLVKREDVFDEITRQMSMTAYNTLADGREKLEFWQSDEGKWTLKNNVPQSDVHVYANAPMCEILHCPQWQILKPNQEDGTHITEISSRASAADLIQTPEIAFLYASLVKENMVGEQNVNLLSVVPMNEFLMDSLPDRGASIYEPQNIIYREIKEKSYTQLSFELRRADGRPFVLLPSLYTEYNQNSGGCVVTLHFRPREINRYTFKSTEKLSLTNSRKRRSADDREIVGGKKVRYSASEVLKGGN